MKHFYIISVMILFVLSGCRKQGPEGKKSLIDLITENPGINCPTGGYKIVTGIDLNNNNILDASEIQLTRYICNGANGHNSLAALVSEPAGPNCSTGGYKLNTGIDINNNNILDPSEISNSQYVCNGIAGNNSLVALVPEPAGSNCPNGGYKVNSGTDSNKNGTLEESEIKSSTYVCNGNDGFNYLISIKAENPGKNCDLGGYSFNTGIDTNKNGILDSNEITATTFICNYNKVNEIRLPLNWSANTNSSTFISGLALANFNKANYVGLDSIVISTNLYTSNPNNHAIFEAYNMTDNVTWEESKLTSNASYDPNNILKTKNLYNVLPAKSINIGLRLRSEVDGQFSAINSGSYLILYSKK